jgi:hypothetical protein
MVNTLGALSQVRDNRQKFWGTNADDRLQIPPREGRRVGAELRQRREAAVPPPAGFGWPILILYRRGSGAGYNEYPVEMNAEAFLVALRRRAQVSFPARDPLAEARNFLELKLAWLSRLPARVASRRCSEGY